MRTNRRGWIHIIALLLFFTLLSLIILHAEGPAGFAPFLNVESFSIVIVGTALTVWAAYPFDEMVRLANAKMLRFAAQTAASMGILGTLLGFILLLPVGDKETVWRRVALALSAYFYGFILSRLVFQPLAERASAKSHE